ncbi:MAG: OmpH family outer membrane protein [Simkaniaceae bacterium]|nr:OmpH family outer membrane protein [Simkaniaceae bacterium]MCF7852335.1 OmpH family outer membrane protein [Simkaniaceae bacterium]
MNNKLFTSTLIALSLSIATHAGIKGASFGIVDFSTCIEESKFGKNERESFESLKKQMISMLTDTEKQLNEVSQKLQDQDYIDGLSPEGEQELKVRFQALNEEMNRYQSQFYQVLQQANMKLMQTMTNKINQASEIIAKDYKIPLILNKEAAFFYDEKFDITQIVVNKLNDEFESQKKAEEKK